MPEPYEPDQAAVADGWLADWLTKNPNDGAALTKAEEEELLGYDEMTQLPTKEIPSAE